MGDIEELDEDHTIILEFEIAPGFEDERAVLARMNFLKALNDLKNNPFPFDMDEFEQKKQSTLHEHKMVLSWLNY